MAHFGTQLHMRTGRTQQTIAGAHRGLKKAPQRLKVANNHHEEERIEKLKRINNQGPLFGWFHTQVIFFGVMWTMGPVWGTEGGQKRPKLSPNRLPLRENEKNELNSEIISVIGWCAILDDQRAKHAHLYSLFYFLHFVPQKVAYWVGYGFITPSWSPKKPKCYFMNSYPKVNALPWQPITIQI